MSGSTGSTSRFAWSYKVCLLVMIGVRADGSKELVALAMGRILTGGPCAVASGRWPLLLAVATAPGVLEGLAGGVPRHPRAAVLVPRQLQCSCRPAEVGAPRCQAALAQIYNAEDRDHALQAVKVFDADYGATWPKRVAKDHRAHRRAAGVLRLGRRALDPPENHQPDRVHLRHRPASAANHQGPGLKSSRRRDGVQAHRVRRSPVARR